MSDERPQLKIGDQVKVREGGHAEMERWSKRDLIGTVVAVEDLPAYGAAVKIKWPDEEVDCSFSSPHQYDLVRRS